jgi:hypothetical protein
MAAELGALILALQTGAPAERVAAAERLAQLGEAAQPAAVALVEACGGEDDALREWVSAALEGLGAPPHEDVAQLGARLSDPNSDAAYWAATLLGRLEDSAAPAVPALAKAVADHPELAARQRSAWALGKIGPAAREARAALEAAAKDADRRLAALAREALNELGD